MSTPLTDIVADIRLLSGLRSNQLYTDADIASMASDSWLDLYDRFVAANQHYRVTSVEFTLAGGIGGNSFTLPAEFQLGNGLEVDPDTQQPKSVPYLSSWLNRNFLGASVFDVAFPGCQVRRYCFNDNQLLVYPPQNAQGNYRLYYTPQEKRLQAPVTVTAAIDASDTIPPITPAPAYPGPGYWAFANIDFSVAPTDGTATVTPTFTGLNVGFNGTYHINGLIPGLDHECSVSETLVGSITGPAAGSVSMTYQPAGTMSAFPDYADPWALYVKLETSIAIRTARQQDVADLERRFQQQSLRVDRSLQNRQEEATQPPLTRDTGGWMGW